jgi:hypothetical protein
MIITKAGLYRRFHKSPQYQNWQKSVQWDPCWYWGGGLCERAYKGSPWKTSNVLHRWNSAAHCQNSWSITDRSQVSEASLAASWCAIIYSTSIPRVAKRIGVCCYFQWLLESSWGTDRPIAAFPGYINFYNRPYWAIENLYRNKSRILANISVCTHGIFSCLYSLNKPRKLKLNYTFEH